MGFGYQIMRTSDGGRHWTGVPLEFGSFMLDISFADRRHGWAVGEQGAAYSTDDGGRTWDFHGVLGGCNGLEAVCMTSPDRAWTAGTNSAIMRWKRPD